MVKINSVKTVQYSSVEVELDGQLLVGQITMNYENYGQNGLIGHIVTVRLNTTRFLQRVFNFTPLPNQYCGADAATAFIAFIEDPDRVADLRKWLSDNSEGQNKG